jgi:AraC-like DNA-binding protein
MTQAEKIQAIMADTKSSLPQKVVHYILSCTIDQLGALTTEKLATIFNTPFITLDIQFKKETKKSFAEFLHFQKMLAVHSLMWQQREKPWSALEISKKIGYKEYPDFVADFEAQFLIHPQRHLEIISEINKNQMN